MKVEFADYCGQPIMCISAENPMEEMALKHWLKLPTKQREINVDVDNYRGGETGLKRIAP